MTKAQCFSTLESAFATNADPTCIYNQCHEDADCDTLQAGMKCGGQLEIVPGGKQKRPGMCTFSKSKAIPSSTDMNVCTHKPRAGIFPYFVKQCESLVATTCEYGDNAKVCMFNSKPVVPSIDIKTCTHHIDFSMSKTVI